MSIVLLRHPAVAAACTKRCYGVSDVPLARHWRASMAAIVDLLRPMQLVGVIHSDLGRTRIAAQHIAAALHLPLDADQRWRERDFGAWEGQSWHAIWRETGDAMDGMLDAPDSFRPGGTGETTLELRDRVVAAHRGLGDARVLVVTHGGPIAALIGTHSQTPVAEWPQLIPACGALRVLD